MNYTDASLVVESYPSALKSLFRCACLLLCAAIWSACSSGTSPAVCDSLTCAGCCTTDGRCETGATINACGTGGASCSVCTDSQQCTSGRCEGGDAGVDAGLLSDGGQDTDAGLDPGMAGTWAGTTFIAIDGGTLATTTSETELVAVAVSGSTAQISAPCGNGVLLTATGAADSASWSTDFSCPAFSTSGCSSVVATFTSGTLSYALLDNLPTMTLSAAGVAAGCGVTAPATLGFSGILAVNYPPLTTFTYSTPQPATTAQATTANNASTSVGQIVVSTSPSNPTGAVNAPRLADGIGEQALVAASVAAPNTPIAAAARQLAIKTRSGELASSCFSVSGDTLTYNDCTFSATGVTIFASGTLTATANTIEWNLTFTGTYSGTAGNESWQGLWTGNVNYTPTSISGSCLSQNSGITTSNGSTATNAWTVGLDFLNMTVAPTCDGGGGIVSGTLEVRANASGSSNPFNLTQKGIEYIWSACDQVSVATSN